MSVVDVGRRGRRRSVCVGDPRPRPDEGPSIAPEAREGGIGVGVRGHCVQRVIVVAQRLVLELDDWVGVEDPRGAGGVCRRAVGAADHRGLEHACVNGVDVGHSGAGGVGRRDSPHEACRVTGGQGQQLGGEHLAGHTTRGGGTCGGRCSQRWCGGVERAGVHATVVDGDAPVDLVAVPAPPSADDGDPLVDLPIPAVSSPHRATHLDQPEIGGWRVAVDHCRRDDAALAEFCWGGCRWLRARSNG